jgi:hypothetical protein
MGDHTESFQVDFDPAVVPYGTLLDLFFSSHNPRRGSFSRQYRCAIFGTPKQVEEAEGWVVNLSDRAERVVTPVLPLERFYRAEDYHQKWELRHDDLLMRELRAMLPDERAFCDSTVAARLNGVLGGNADPALLAEELPLFGLSPEAQGRFLSLR